MVYWVCFSLEHYFNFKVLGSGYLPNIPNIPLKHMKKGQSSSQLILGAAAAVFHMFVPAIYIWFDKSRTSKIVGTMDTVFLELSSPLPLHIPVLEPDNSTDCAENPLLVD